MLRLLHHKVIDYVLNKYLHCFVLIEIVSCKETIIMNQKMPTYYCLYLFNSNVLNLWYGIHSDCSCGLTLLMLKVSLKKLKSGGNWFKNLFFLHDLLAVSLLKNKLRLRDWTVFDFFCVMFTVFQVNATCAKWSCSSVGNGYALISTAVDSICCYWKF